MHYSSTDRGFIVKGSTSDRILRMVETDGAVTSSQLRRVGKGGNLGVCTLSNLVRHRKLSKFDFWTPKGKVYYRDEKRAFDFCIRHELIPEAFNTVEERIDRNGAVSTVELRDLEVSSQDIYWFTHTFARARMIKVGSFKHNLVLFHDEDKLKRYYESIGPGLDDLESKVNIEAGKRGDMLEETIAKYYEMNGFKVEKNKYFRDKKGNLFEVDVLATMPELGIMIAAECKNYERFTLGSNVFLHISKIRSVMPRATIHLWAKNVSNYIINSDFWDQNDHVWIFTGKKIKEVCGKVNGLQNVQGIPIKAM